MESLKDTKLFGSTKTLNVIGRVSYAILGGAITWAVIALTKS